MEDTCERKERMLSSGWGTIRCEERNGCEVFWL